VGDRQGSTVVAVRPDGIQENIATYVIRGPFGTQEGAVTIGSLNTQTGYTGASTPTQSGGFTYLRNRWYDPKTGRFLTQDPIGLAGGVNLYAYAGNNPISFRDPFGLCPDNLETEPCTPGTVIYRRPSSNSILRSFLSDAAYLMNATVVVHSADRTATPKGSKSNQSEHRTDQGKAGAVDLHVYQEDGTKVSDANAAKTLGLARSLLGTGVRIIWHTKKTNTEGEHVHVDTRTDVGDREESRGQYERINFND
jgi:RHS repeat-associated protein